MLYQEEDRYDERTLAVLVPRAPRLEGRYMEVEEESVVDWLVRVYKAKRIHPVTLAKDGIDYDDEEEKAKKPATRKKMMFGEEPKIDMEVHWVTKPTDFNVVKNTMVVYGNQADVGFAYGYMTIIVTYSSGRENDFSLATSNSLTFLSACANYFSNNTYYSDENTASALRLCYLIFQVKMAITPEIIHAWKTMLSACRGYLKNSRSELSPERVACPWTGEREHSQTCKAAHAILLHFEYNLPLYRCGPGTDPVLEDRAYHRWLTEYDELNAWLPDDMLEELRALICHDHCTDENSDKLWYIRRLEDVTSGIPIAV
ncbi:hypothetical protein NM688_g5755 [Phlebia brevispora]|uniref:Uncharacterized protein n=1 Tax=Phlebia brevispora TaxID=194682 RepID=A0ACC1SQC9_9APHY|nr:hypothetical protein NM688_g5755 [Phlebia brevispora]